MMPEVPVGRLHGAVVSVANGDQGSRNPDSQKLGGFSERQGDGIIKLAGWRNDPPRLRE